MLEINTALAKQLIEEQFPQWSKKKISPVKDSGHDNRTFHLGEDMTIRMPSGADYAAQVEKELEWLPYLSKHLSYPISTPITAGKPSSAYPYPWSINRWLPGDTLNQIDGVDNIQLAVHLASALKELQQIDATGGPVAGKHNFYRGGHLSIYHEDTQRILKELHNLLPTDRLSEIWDLSCSSKWEKQGVWVHGDIAPGNLLIQNRILAGLIDFGILGVGDPACDYSIAWSYFDPTSRAVFLKESGIDIDTWNRARGWALWKALIDYHDKIPFLREQARFTIQAILEEEIM